MATRAPVKRALSRALSTANAGHSRASVAGSRIDTIVYTDTGGSGLDSTALSSNLAEASAKAIAVYRQALRDIPDMRKNFTIIEGKEFVTKCVRDLFERHAHVTDPKLVDMLVFKARQELREIAEQWKSRHHVYGYIQRYSEKVLREEAKRKLKEGDRGKEALLQTWRERGLVPSEVLTWGHFEKWREEEDEKFKAFVEENRVFEKGVLERNASAAQGCSVM